MVATVRRYVTVPPILHVNTCPELVDVMLDSKDRCE